MAIYNGLTKVAGSGNMPMITVTKAQYDALTTEERAGNVYLTVDEFELNIFDLIYPIGSIYPSVNSANPSTFFGGTWVAWGQGRVPMGVGSIEVNTDTAEGSVTAGAINKASAEVKGGEKAHVLTVAELASHTHNIAVDGGAGTTYAKLNNATSGVNPTPEPKALATGSDAAHNNVQPYITCYMWKRTA